jgi:nucleotide-binding universal stress UspA family protein
MKTFKKIIVATDFSDNAKSAYRYARQLATRFGASIEVVNFFEIPINPGNPNYMDMMPTFAQLEEAANNRLARFVNESENGDGSTMVASRIKTTFKTQAGFATDGLIEMSKEPSVDLIILGATGEHGWIDKIFGSIAVKVSREAYCPVMLIPHGAEYRGIHHMVYTSSFDSAQPTEIKVALDFAKYFASAIHFVHVITQPDDLGISEKLLFKRLVSDEHTKVPFTVENTHAFTAVEGINQYILNNDVDLLVTVTQHRTFWEKLMHLSTTKELAWNIHIPLLVLHHDEKSQPPSEG